MVLSLLLFTYSTKIIAISTFLQTIDARYLKDQKQFSIMWYNLGMIVVYCVIALQLLLFIIE
jgi:hypothetical protein